MKIGIRSDVHARHDIAKKHMEELKAGAYQGIFDLGDIEAEHIGEEHPLRQGQDPKTEQTMDAIIRNSLADGKITDIGQEAVRQTLESVARMLQHEAEISSVEGIVYRGIAGNGTEAWTKIFGKIAPDQVDELQELFQGFTYMRDAKAELVKDGKLYVPGELKQADSALIYLPWKASIESVEDALQSIDGCDAGKVVVLSHDYLTKGSVPSDVQGKIKPMQNEKQIITTLDAVAKRDNVEGYFGHIGLEYGQFGMEFQHGGKKIKTYHVDEKHGKFVEVDL